MQTPDEKLALQAVHDAYEQGVNFFDVAPFYGAGSAERVCCSCKCRPRSKWEPLRCRPSSFAECIFDPVRCTEDNATACVQLLGRCIEDLPRDDLFICTKVGGASSGAYTHRCWPYLHKVVWCGSSAKTAYYQLLLPELCEWQVGKYKPGESEDFSAERVTRSVHESLERLGLKYIDLIICHDIESAVDMKQACRLQGAPSPVTARVQLQNCGCVACLWVTPLELPSTRLPCRS